MAIELLVIGGAAGPHHWCCRLLAGSAALTFLVKRPAQSTDDQPADRCRVAEPHLRLCRMDVHVDLLERNVEEKSRDRVPVAGNEIAIGGAQGADEQLVLHRPIIYEKKLLVGHSAVERRQAYHAGQTEPVPRAVDADAVPD